MYNVGINNAIMHEWENRYKGIPLIFDGAVSPSRYWAEPIKVVICLKECVMYQEDSGSPLEGKTKTIPGDGRFKTSEDSYSITDYLYKNGGLGGSPTWTNECRIAELLLEGKNIHKFDEPDGMHRRNIFRRIGHMELSKLGGTPLQSPWYEKIINDNKDLIGKQLSNFDANYYVICGKPSWEVVKSVINLEDYKHISVKVEHNGGNMEFWTCPEKNKTLILMRHPSDIYRFDKQLAVIKTFIEA